MTQLANAIEPFETGGILLGYWSENPAAPVITECIGPGPNSKHERTRFVPDHNFHEEEVARLYIESKCTLQYLGDWHSHPGNAGIMSGTDLNTLKRIASSRAANAPRPLMLILAYGPSWDAVVWSLLKRTRFGVLHSFAQERWDVSQFSENTAGRVIGKTAGY